MLSYRLKLAAAACLFILVLLGGCRGKSGPAASRQISPGGGVPPLLIDLPPEYNLERRQGADFEVFYIQRARTEHGDPPKDGMGIYFGHAPSFSPPREARTLGGTIAGRKITWYAWEDDTSDRTLLRMQTLIPDLFAGAKDKTGGIAGLRVHIFAWAPGEKRLGILRDAAETLRWKQETP